MNKKMMLIINPVAGRGSFRNALSDIIETFCRGGYLITVFMTDHNGHASEFVRESSSDFDVVVCCGGDGTLSETISGLMDLSEKPRLGYIPMGTANDVASTLGLPRNAKEAAEIIVAGKDIPFDVGNMDGHYFTYISAFGAFTQVSYETPSESKQVLGHLAYILESVGHFGSITPYNLVAEYDGERIEGEFIFGAVTNTTSIAGLLKLKNELVSLGDGEFEVILIKNPKNLIDFNTIFMGLLSQSYNPEYVKIFKTSKVKFTFDQPVSWTRDGEAGGEYEEITLANINAPIRFIVPEHVRQSEALQLTEGEDK